MITRDEWSEEQWGCMACDHRWHNSIHRWHNNILHTHEIVTRACNANSPNEPCTWLRVCRECHGQMVGGTSAWPIARQLALKKLRDPEHYDRQRVNVLRGRAPDAITEEEVDSYMEGLLCTQTETNSKRKSQS